MSGKHLIRVNKKGQPHEQQSDYGETNAYKMRNKHLQYSEMVQWITRQ